MFECTVLLKTGTMRNLISNLLMLLVLSTPLVAQHSSNDDSKSLRKDGHRIENWDIVRNYDDRYEGVVGSPFLFKHWHAGYFINESDHKIGMLKLNYDAYKGQIVADRNGESSFVVLNDKNIKRCVITIREDSIVFVKAENIEGIEGAKYLELMYEQNEVIVLKHHVKMLMDANFRQPHNAENRNDEFVDKTFYYVDWGSGPQPFKLNKGSIKKTFKDKAFNVNQVAERHNFNFKEEVDVVNLFKLYAEAKP